MSYFKSVKLFFKSESREFGNWVDNTCFNSEYFFFKGTCLARFLRAENTLILSADALSLTHSSYLRALASNSGLTSENLIYVPQFVHNHPFSHSFDSAGLLKVYDLKLNELAGGNNEYCNRQFVKCVGSLKRLSELGIVDGTDLLEKHESAFKMAVSGLKSYDEKMKEFIGSHERLELVDIAYFKAGSYDVPFRKYLRDYLNKSGGLSFLHFDGTMMITDESVCGAPKEVMNASDCAEFLKVWEAGEMRRGKKFGAYTVLAYHDGVVHIGCNKYPAWLFDEFVKMFHGFGLL